MHTIQFYFGSMHLFKMANNQFRLFSGKIVIALADIFAMEKALFKIVFWHKFFIYLFTIFKIFVARFTTFEMQNFNMEILYLGSFRKLRF